MKKFVSLIVVALTLTTFVLTGCSSSIKEVNPNLTKDEISYNVPVVSSSPSVGVTFGMPRTVEEGENVYIERELTILVQPLKADKRVELSAYWKDGASRSEEDVNDYVQIIHDKADSPTAYLRVSKAFGNDIILLKVQSVMFPTLNSTCELRYGNFVKGFEFSSFFNTELNLNIDSQLSTNYGEHFELLCGVNNDTGKGVRYNFYPDCLDVFGNVLNINHQAIVSIRPSCGLYFGTLDDGGMFTDVHFVDDFSGVFSRMVEVSVIDYQIELTVPYSFYDLFRGFPDSTLDTAWWDLHPGPFSYATDVLYYYNETILGERLILDGVDVADYNQNAIKDFHFIMRIEDSKSGYFEEIKLVLGSLPTSIEIPDNVEF